MQAYAPEEYDSNLALKPTFLLIVVMVYCVLPWLFILLAFNPSPRFQAGFAYFQHFATPASFFCGLPAALVMLAWAKRLPAAASTWRHVWRHGRSLLSLSLGAQTLLLYSRIHISLWNSYVLSEGERFVVFSMGMNLLAVYYLWRLRRISDVFADFPAAPPAP